MQRELSSVSTQKIVCRKTIVTHRYYMRGKGSLCKQVPDQCLGTISTNAWKCARRPPCMRIGIYKQELWLPARWLKFRFIMLCRGSSCSHWHWDLLWHSIPRAMYAVSSLGWVSNTRIIVTAYDKRFAELQMLYRRLGMPSKRHCSCTWSRSPIIAVLAASLHVWVSTMHAAEALNFSKLCDRRLRHACFLPSHLP